jgi:hypothetical protein
MSIMLIVQGHILMWPVADVLGINGKKKNEKENF